MGLIITLRPPVSVQFKKPYDPKKSTNKEKNGKKTLQECAGTQAFIAPSRNSNVVVVTLSWQLL